MKKFKRIYIEITNVCNASCRACPKTSREPEFMGRDLFEKIIDEVKGYSRHLYFHVMGEPLLHPDIDTFLDLCGERALEVNITTNGTLIKEAKDILLSKPAIRSINFSLNRFDEKTPIKDIDECLDEVFNFITELGPSSKMIVCFRLWNMEIDDTQNSNQRVQETGKNSYILGRLENFFKVSGGIKETLFIGNGFKLKDNVYVSQRSFFDWPDKDISDLGEEGFCLGLRQQIAILADGTVVPCCLDNEGTIDLGNINEASFKEIIEGKRARDLYKGFSERKVVEPLCRKCGYRERFDQ
ncbi:MAG: SPASM domain-containing protein [Candidatus Aadella gelida]|nr:SPASM domain-containing protein [Candidatus Aadella gelida]